mmetsp:Transcript_118572/g.335419  ORF Transcript_118572/g.335419 Transcript_118572/m.335419 type:complete len:405 (-) Transcript_118572:21-1235(-)
MEGQVVKRCTPARIVVGELKTMSGRESRVGSLCCDPATSRPWDSEVANSSLSVCLASEISPMDWRAEANVADCVWLLINSFSKQEFARKVCSNRLMASSDTLLHRRSTRSRVWFDSAALASVSAPASEIPLLLRSSLNKQWFFSRACPSACAPLSVTKFCGIARTCNAVFETSARAKATAPEFEMPTRSKSSTCKTLLKRVAWAIRPAPASEIWLPEIESCCTQLVEQSMRAKVSSNAPAKFMLRRLNCRSPIARGPSSMCSRACMAESSTQIPWKSRTCSPLSRPNTDAKLRASAPVRRSQSALSVRGPDVNRGRSLARKSSRNCPGCRRSSSTMTDTGTSSLSVHPAAKLNSLTRRVGANVKRGTSGARAPPSAPLFGERPLQHSPPIACASGETVPSPRAS